MSDELKGWKPSVEVKDVLEKEQSLFVPGLGSDINSLVDKSNAKKEAIIKERLKSYGIEIDWDVEKKARFKSLTCERYTEDDTEIWYYNDGTHGGKRIITFRRKKPDFNMSSRDFKFEVNYEYY